MDAASSDFEEGFNTSLPSPPAKVSVPDTTFVNAKVLRRRPMAIFSHDDCIAHVIDGHPEQPLRVISTLKKLHQHYPDNCFFEAPMVTEEQILRFHTAELWEKLQSLFRSAEHGEGAKEIIDSDTIVMKHSRKAILRAAGAMVAAVDAVLGPGETDCETDASNNVRCANNSNSNLNSSCSETTDRITPVHSRAAFCCTRPPGHHAEPDRSMGFCFLNNAGIAAHHAVAVYGLPRVAVVDFDVHHGNGTEAGFSGDPRFFYGSTHEQYNFPGTGSEPAKIGIEARTPFDRRIVNRFLPSGQHSVAKFRAKWAQVVDEMELFKPSLVIISAGFDAHKFDPLGGCELREADFQWATTLVMQACQRLNPSSPIPIISVLEGGYNMHAVNNSTLVHVQTLTAALPALPELSSTASTSLPPTAPVVGDEVGALQEYLASLEL